MIEDNFGDFVVREFLVSRNDEEIRTTQYQYISWPDHGVPQSPTALIEVMTSIETLKEQTLKEEKSISPCLVHCR